MGANAKIVGEATLVQYAACPSLTGGVQFDSDYSDEETPYHPFFLHPVCDSLSLRFLDLRILLMFWGVTRFLRCMSVGGLFLLILD